MAEEAQRSYTLAVTLTDPDNTQHQARMRLDEATLHTAYAMHLPDFFRLAWNELQERVITELDIPAPDQQQQEEQEATA